MRSQYQAVARKLDQLFLGRRMVFFRAFQNNGLYQGQLPILEYVLRNQGCTQKEIADELFVSPASIASSTKRLQKAGLMEKKTDESNLRQNKLFVTEKGSFVAENCRKEFNHYNESFLYGFTDEELTLLSSFLDRIVANMADGNSSGCPFPANWQKQI